MKLLLVVKLAALALVQVVARVPELVLAQAQAQQVLAQPPVVWAWLVQLAWLLLWVQ